MSAVFGGVGRVVRVVIGLVFVALGLFIMWLSMVGRIGWTGWLAGPLLVAYGVHIMRGGAFFLVF